MAEIRIDSADGVQRTLPMARERMTIGRSRESDIHLPDQWLSRRHAEIQRRADGYYIVDLKSKNGTLVNDRPIEKDERLVSGDVIALGEHRLTFVDEAAVAVDEADNVPPGTLVFSARDMLDSLVEPDSQVAAPTFEKRFVALLTGATTALFTHRPLPEIFEQILTLLLDAIPAAERAAILLLEGSPARPVIKASRARSGEIITSVSRSIARKVVEEKVVLHIPNVLEDAGLSTQESILAAGIRSALCAPLWYRAPESDQDVVIGLVYLDVRWRTDAFAEEDRPIVTALANVAAAKIENARLLEESIEKRRMEDDIRMAAEIQASLLPREAPRVPGYDLVGSTRPCHGIGGDYFDLLLIDGELLMALGDVSGKGTSAALLMTMLRAAVRGHWKDASVAAAVARINQTVYENTPANKYITFFLAHLDVASGRVSYVNAGHNPPIVVRAAGAIETLREGGVVLGLVDGAEYSEGAVALSSGDALLVYSDGVTETWSPDGEEWGDARLTEAASRGRGLDARSLESEILRQLERFSGGLKATDDRTLIILKKI
jgi:sigma-B regulation protein RsbU (phosphoserine phosphatase)